METTQATHILFKPHGPSDTGKTFIWLVITKDERTRLGEIRWFGRWRKYAFFPSPNCVFEQTCLRDIANFIELATKQQRAKSAIESLPKLRKLAP